MNPVPGPTAAELPPEPQAPSQKPLVIVSGLAKQFGEFRALRDCQLEISNGEVFGLLGPNGAGKTTLIRLLMGFMQPTSGSASIADHDVYQQRVEVHRNVAYLPGDARLPRMMSGREVLRFFSGLRPDASHARALEIADRLELDLSRWVAFMSTGMRQKLALAVVLSIECPLLILDEPTANLDPTVRGEVIQMVGEARSRGRTVILSSHVLSEIEESCERVGILRAGKLVCLMEMSELQSRHRVSAEWTGADSPQMANRPEGVLPPEFRGSRVCWESAGDLKQVLPWLCQQPLRDVRIEPIGLRTIYDQYHSKSEDK